MTIGSLVNVSFSVFVYCLTYCDPNRAPVPRLQIDDNGDHCHSVQFERMNHYLQYYRIGMSAGKSLYDLFSRVHL